MFKAAFGASSVGAVYLRLASPDAKETVRTAESMGIRGLNITSPYKEKILPFLDDIDEAARRSGAVNTIVARQGKLAGFNTDVDGVREALIQHGVTIRGEKALILGAGGAAKAAALALTSEGARVTLVNRTVERARDIARTLPLSVASLDAIEEEMSDTRILVACMSEGAPVVPPRCLTEGLVVLDAHYREETRLVREAKERKCTVIDGREWLLFQGASAFSHFTGKEPPVPAMRRALYDNGIHVRKNVALIGFMGTGKSTVSRCLAESLKMTHIDIDSEIERKNGSSIADIFANQGEAPFRRMEVDEIGAAARMSGAVISCGGGAVLERTNVERLRENSIVIWLNAGVETILHRVGKGGSRPLLNVPDRRSQIEKMLRQRRDHYAFACDLVVDTDRQETDEIVKRIYDEISTSIER